jgi:hypothetical protein
MPTNRGLAGFVAATGNALNVIGNVLPVRVGAAVRAGLQSSAHLLLGEKKT